MTDSERRARKAQSDRAYKAAHQEKQREYRRNYKLRRAAILSSDTPRCPVCLCKISVTVDCERP